MRRIFGLQRKAVRFCGIHSYDILGIPTKLKSPFSREKMDEITMRIITRERDATELIEKFIEVEADSVLGDHFYF